MKISGIVIKGRQKGKELGFPTANVVLRDEIGIEDGIYAGKVIFEKKEYKAAIFVKDNMLEAHILDFDGDLYGKEIEVEIGKKIREVIKFDNEEQLKKQIAKDIELIRCSRE